MSMLSRQNGGVHFLLTCIDILSKYAWAIPMKNKSAASTKEALQQIFTERKPRSFQTDSGREFENETVCTYLQHQGIHQFFAWNPAIKCSVVERFNRTLKSKIWRYMTFARTKRYIDVLPDLMHSYNHSYHRSIKMAPADVNDM